MSDLTAWSSYFVITGSSAAALTGLMFVVITLIAGVERMRSMPDGIRAFNTPTVVHFCAALFISATLSAPWHLLLHPAILLALAGFGGVWYAVHVMRRIRTTSNYSADVEDLVWYALLPLGAYVALVVAALLLPRNPVDALFALAGISLLFIFIGIRNAWDVVTYIATGDYKRP